MSQEPIGTQSPRTDALGLAAFMGTPAIGILAVTTLMGALVPAALVLSVTAIAAGAWASSYWQRYGPHPTPYSMGVRLRYICGRLGLPARPFIVAWWLLFTLCCVLYATWWITKPGP